MNSDIFGYIGTSLNIIMLVPQVHQTWKTKQTKGLSLATLLMFFIACMFWLIYGLMRSAGPVIISNSALGIMNLMLILFKLKYK